MEQKTILIAPDSFKESLDARLPYFYAKVAELFSKEPEEVQIVLVG